MELVHSIILGIVQGIGEFLPISSSAHLKIVPFLFGWEAHSMAFDVALHVGTLIAVLAVFWKDWFELVKGAYDKVFHNKSSFNNKMFWYLVIATIPGAIIGKLFEDKIDLIFSDQKNIWIIAILLAFMGILIYLGDKYAAKKYSGKETEYKDLTLKQTFLIGLSQAFAVIPGFSRSGTTILTARLLGVSREASAKFTFLLSAPIICGAAVLKVPELFVEGSSIMPLIVGVIVAAIVGIISIKFLLNYIKKNDFAIFAYYRVIIAVIIVVKYFVLK